MKKKHVKNLLIIVLTSNLLLTSCWNYREINKLSIVTGFAIDKSQNSDNYIITAEMIDFETSGTEMKIKSKIVESEGETIFDAIRNIIQLSGRRLYWGHAKIVILSENIAKNGLAKVLDMICRDAEMRSDMYLLISKEKTAGKIFQHQISSSQIASYEIMNMLESEKSLGKAPIVKVYNYVSSISEKMASGILPTIKLHDNLDKKISRLIGTAIFKNDKLIGYLDSTETKFLLFTLKQFNRGLLIMKENSEGQLQKISLEVFNTKTKISPKVENNKLIMKIGLDIDASIGELETTKDFITEDKHNKLEIDSAISLKENLISLIKKVQNEFDVDIFEFEKHIKADLPKQWKTIQKNWDVVYRNLPVDIKVKINLRNSGLASKPLKVGE